MHAATRRSIPIMFFSFIDCIQPIIPELLEYHKIEENRTVATAI